MFLEKDVNSREIRDLKNSMLAFQSKFRGKPSIMKHLINRKKLRA